MQKTDLIDRKALLKALRKEKRECEKDGEEFGGESILYAEAFEDAIDMVKNQPAADAAPVVRCKDCKNRGTPYSCPMRKLVMPWQGAGSYEDCTDDDGYCHMGVKKDEPSP